jgi:hypothetical protein
MQLNHEELALCFQLDSDTAIRAIEPTRLEYIPYCTRDGTATRDEAIHPYFAGHGYAAVRVDIRGRIAWMSWSPGSLPGLIAKMWKQRLRWLNALSAGTDLPPDFRDL